MTSGTGRKVVIKRRQFRDHRERENANVLSRNRCQFLAVWMHRAIGRRPTCRRIHRHTGTRQQQRVHADVEAHTEPGEVRTNQSKHRRVVVDIVARRRDERDIRRIVSVRNAVILERMNGGVHHRAQIAESLQK